MHAMRVVSVVLAILLPLACAESRPPSEALAPASDWVWISLDRPGCKDCSGRVRRSDPRAQSPASRTTPAVPRVDSATRRVPPTTPTTPRSPRPPASQSGERRPRVLSAREFAVTLTWNEMEPIGVFAGRMPAGVSGGPVGRTGQTRRFRYAFPGGGAIILLARPCEGRDGLCVWAVDIE